MRFVLLSLLGWFSIVAAEPAKMHFVDSGLGAKLDFKVHCGVEDKYYLTETIGTGAAWLDYDGDGHLDLFLVNGSDHGRRPGEGEPNRLFRGDGKGGFKETTKRAGVGDRGWGYGVTVGDIDNDGDADLYVTNLGANRLYLNDGNGKFTDVTERAGVGNPSWGTSAAFFDMEADGDLDLYVANYVEFDLPNTPRRGVKRNSAPFCTFKGLTVVCGPVGLPAAPDVLYRNNGDGTFTDVTEKAGVALTRPLYSLGVVSGDYDNDGDTDVYVANDSVQNLLWRNRGDGTFEEVALLTLSALNVDGQPQSGMGTNFGDYTGDGYLDLVVTNFSHDLNTLYRNHESKYFVDESTLVGMGATTMALSWGVGFQDFDQDGDLDLFIANGHIYPNMDQAKSGTTYLQVNHLFDNDGGRLTEVGSASGPGLKVERSFRGAAFGDYDEDGDVDIVATAMDDELLLLRNETKRQGHYLKIRLEGTASNRDGVGARVTLTSGGRKQIREVHGGGSFMSHSDYTIHFGLGSGKLAERIEVRWPSGTVDVLEKVAGDRTVTVKEGSYAP